MQLCTHAHIHMHTHARIHMHTHMDAYMCAHTCSHTCKPVHVKGLHGPRQKGTCRHTCALMNMCPYEHVPFEWSAARDPCAAYRNPPPPAPRVSERMMNPKPTRVPLFALPLPVHGTPLNVSASHSASSPRIRTAGRHRSLLASGAKAQYLSHADCRGSRDVRMRVVVCVRPVTLKQ